MNKGFIIGNLVRDPESRSVSNGTAVCTFTVAVNRRNGAKAGQPEADYFRVTAWRGLAEICGKYLAKGRKVAVVGTVSLNTYTGQDGNTRSTIEITADDVEFLSPREADAPAAPVQKKDAQTGFVQVEDDELPF